MVILYPVNLFPLNSVRLHALESLKSPGKNHYAIISEDSVIVTADSPIELGVEYHKISLENLDGFESKIESLSHDCPIDIINSGEEKHRVRSLGRLHQLEFENGLLINTLEKKE